MCGPTDTSKAGRGFVTNSTTNMMTTTKFDKNTKMTEKLPVELVLAPPSLVSRYACASIMIAIFAIWGKISFMDEKDAPGIGSDIHSWHTPLMLTVGYLITLPLLRYFSKNVLSQFVDVKLLLKETMIVYNGGQVLLNAWMVYRFVHALMYKGHPYIGDLYTNTSGTTFAVWIHYMDKYLEFFDTFFMVLRGRMDQVSFLHVYHHISIAWAWWFAVLCYPGGDAYFGALLNSWIHVMMYSYYTMSLLKFSCPWKRYLTQAQLLQFTLVVIYTIFSTGIQIRDGVAEPKHYACFAVQAFEMISMLVLFMHFYSKAYKKKQAEKERSSSSSVSSDVTASVDSDISDLDVVTSKKQQ